MKIFDIQKYLRKNPVQDGKLIRSCSGFFSFAAVIPILNENENAEMFFTSLKRAADSTDENILIITVVNCAENSPDDYKENNQILLQRLCNNEFALSNLAVIDCTSQGRTIKDGVGEARKIGMDFALNYFDINDFENSIIASLDADTSIDENYFSTVRKLFDQQKNAGVLTFNVQHRNDAANPDTIKQYELYLRSYREGLASANSPYAFFTVGSAFAARASSYIRAGGMRKLKAGEDFYFLQSAVKSSSVRHSPEVTVYPSARYSPRVPFGTGTALCAIDNNEKEYNIFPPQAFGALKKIINAATVENLSSAEKFLSTLPADFKTFFTEQNFEQNWCKVIANMPPEKLPEAFTIHWFDGLKTLQFIKYISKKIN